MKVSELRELLKGKETKMIVDVLVETYKAVPKNKKEDLDITIQSLLSGKGKTKEKNKVEINCTELFSEIEEFEANAYARNYFIPNRVIPKKERPKWRFKAKRYIKDLMAIPCSHKEFKTATDYLIKIYNVLRHGCEYYIFSTEDPFQSVGFEQEYLFNGIVERMIQANPDVNTMQDLIDMIVGNGYSYECTHDYLYAILDMTIKNPIYRTMMVEAARNRLSKYSGKENIDYCGEFYVARDILFIFRNDNKEDAFNEYFKYVYSDLEVTLYTLLELIERLKNDNVLWIEAYEYGIKQGIEPRERLREKYEEYKGALTKLA